MNQSDVKSSSMLCKLALEIDKSYSASCYLVRYLTGSLQENETNEQTSSSKTDVKNECLHRNKQNAAQ